MLKRIINRSTAILLTITLITSSLTFVLSGCTKNEEKDMVKVAEQMLENLDKTTPSFADTELEAAGNNLYVAFDSFSDSVAQGDLSAVQLSAQGLKQNAQQLLIDLDAYKQNANNIISSENDIIKQRQADFEADVKAKATRTVELLDDIIGSKDKSSLEFVNSVDEINSIFKPEKPKMLGAEMENNAIPVSSPEKVETEDAETYAKHSVAAVGAYAPNSSSLSLYEETSLTDEMKALTNELKSPLAVYLYVKNNFRTEFYSGLRKGAIATFDAKSGNDTDQASLLIAMLRYLGYNARYVSGTIYLTNEQALKLTCADNIESAGSILISSGKNVTAITQGGKITGVKLNQTWVEAYIPYTDYRGAGNQGGEKRWVPLDPSVKEYKRVESMYDHPEIFGLTPEALTTPCSEQSVREAYEKVNEYCDQHPEESVNLTPWQIVSENLDYIPLSLQYTVKSMDREFDSAASISDSISFSVNGETLATLKSYEMYDKRVMLEYVPSTSYDASVINSSGSLFNANAYLVKMIPTIKLDGEIVGEGEDVSLGKTEAFRISINSEGKTTVINNEVTVGSMYCIAQDMQSVTEKELNNAVVDAKGLNTQASDKEIYDDEFIGKILNYIGKFYYAQVDAANVVNALQSNISCTRSLSVAVTAYEVEARTMYGIPVGISEGSMNIDVDVNKLAAVSLTGNKNDEISFMMSTGVLSSSYESSVWETVIGRRCVSTISIMERARFERQEIMVLTKENFDQNKSKLHADSETYQTIADAVSAGKDVIVHADKITIDSWKGFGYIILTPETGGGAYMISGGLNGGSSGNIVTIKGVLGILLNMIVSFTVIASGVAAIGGIIASGGIVLLPIAAIAIVMAVTAWQLGDSMKNYTELMVRYHNGDTSVEQELNVSLILDCFFAAIGGGVGKKVYNSVLNSELGRKYGQRIVAEAMKLESKGFDSVKILKFIDEIAESLPGGFLQATLSLPFGFALNWIFENLGELFSDLMNRPRSDDNSGNSGSGNSGSGNNGSGNSDSGNSGSGNNGSGNNGSGNSDSGNSGSSNSGSGNNGSGNSGSGNNGSGNNGSGNSGSGNNGGSDGSGGSQNVTTWTTGIFVNGKYTCDIEKANTAMNLCRDAKGNEGGKLAAKVINDYGDAAIDSIIKCGEAGANKAYEAARAIDLYGKQAAELLVAYGIIALDAVFNDNEETVINASKQIKDDSMLEAVLTGVQLRSDLTQTQQTAKQILIKANAGVSQG